MLSSGRLVAQNYTLTVYNHFGGGGPENYGTMVVEPLQVTCTSSTYCEYAVPANTTVTVFAFPPAGSVFGGWFQGPCVGSAVPVCRFTMTGHITVQAGFSASPGPYTLTVYKGVPGLGNGSVSGPDGFFCGPADGSCSRGGFASGTTAFLTNTPAPGWSFAYWRVDGVTLSNSAPLAVRMNGDKLVQAIFAPNNQPPTVVLLFPTNGQSVWACAPFPITATAQDPDGSITSLEFFLESVSGPLIGRQVFDPSTNGASVTATVFWKISALGVTNTFLARATDNSGAQTVSSPVQVVTTLPPLHHLIASLTTNRECELCMHGETGRVYRVLAATNLAATNSASWAVIGFMQGTNGLFKYLDPSVTNLPRRFYRSHSP